jgi:hypothetical protein
VADGFTALGTPLPWLSLSLAPERTLYSALSLLTPVGLTLDYAGEDVAAVAQQTLLLSPGRYRLATHTKLDLVTIDAATSPLGLSVTCLPDGKSISELALPLDGTEHKLLGAPFEVTAACPAQMLILKAGPIDFGKRVAGHIRAITVEAVQ